MTVAFAVSVDDHGGFFCFRPIGDGLYSQQGGISGISEMIWLSTLSPPPVPDVRGSVRSLVGSVPSTIVDLVLALDRSIAVALSMPSRPHERFREKGCQAGHVTPDRCHLLPLRVSAAGPGRRGQRVAKLSDPQTDGEYGKRVVFQDTRGMHRSDRREPGKMGSTPPNSDCSDCRRIPSRRRVEAICTLNMPAAVRASVEAQGRAGQMTSVSGHVLVLVTAALMPDLAGLNDVKDGNPPCVTICGSGARELHPVSSPATQTQDRRFENCFHVLTDGAEPGL
ncbi:unnamed protein product [Dibothriocephalus latus]|uniref:Uncharacterized protein n=1 Tax=Dibothriocephalus latus TaxID=60516 RepID=A0A3P7L9J9_DIBLA|nr:unnamed protein product [Dibothriocephalus latus]